MKSISEYSIYCLKINADKEGANAGKEYPIGLIMIKNINDKFEYIDQIGKVISVQTRGCIKDELSSEKA